MRKQIKPKRLLNKEEQKESVSNQMIPMNESPLDLSVKKNIDDLSKKCKFLNNEKENQDHESMRRQSTSTPSISNNDECSDKPLDLRVNRKKVAQSGESIKTSTAAAASAICTKLVRGQDEWMNNSRNNFIYQILKCLVCSKSFPSLNDLSLHMLESKHFSKFNSSSSTPFSVEQTFEQTNKTTTPSIKKNSNIKSPSSLNVLLCLICKKSFSNGTHLVEHLQNSHTISQICTTCGAYFESNTAYNQHLIDQDYHHHHHSRSKQQQQQKANTNTTCSSNNNKRLKTEKKKISSEENNKSRTNNSNPLSALELFVSSTAAATSDANVDSKYLKTKLVVENPLNLLQKMHSNFTNYVF